MSRLIDAELIEKEEGWLDETCLVIPKQIIYDAPTVEAKPIKHGHWIWDKSANMGAAPKCSVCGLRSHSGAWAGENNYCPVCGAKMDEEKQLMEVKTLKFPVVIADDAQRMILDELFSDDTEKYLENICVR